MIAGAGELPEAALPPELARRLPANPPPAPWSVRAALVVWWHRATPDAGSCLPAGLRGAPHLPVTLWMLVRYSDTPVGPYAELLCSPLLLRRPFRLHVPFIAVDSVPSVAAGRTNWALPKVLAAFDWSAGHPVEVTARSEQPATPAWRLHATAEPGAVPVPMRGRGLVEQLADGRPLRYRSRVRGVARLGHVEVDATAEGPLGGLLRPGRHRCLVTDQVSLVVEEAS